MRGSISTITPEPCVADFGLYDATGREARVDDRTSLPIDVYGRSLAAGVVCGRCLRAVRFAHRQELTAAGRNAEHVPQGPRQFIRQPSQFFRARLLVDERA